MSAMPVPVTQPNSTSGGTLVDAEGRALPLLGGHLTVDAAGGLARVVLRQRFVNPHDEPLRVTYQVPLPADAAVGGYAFELAGERVTGVVEPRAKARQRFEEALVAGRTAALLEQERSSLFRQEVGNLPPRGEVVCELQLDQLLAWERAGWTWRFPTVVAPRFLGERGRVPDADAVSVEASKTTTPRVTLSLAVRDATTGPLVSPTHALHVVGQEAGLADEAGAALDRDVVVRWPVAAPSPGVSLDATLDVGGHGLLTLVPPAIAVDEIPRDLVLLLDTSGSMGGRPLDQAKAVCRALIATLTERDQLQMIEFSTRPRSWNRSPVAMSQAGRTGALAWLAGLQAGGGTQMKDGILAALDTLRPEAQRQVVLVTDGLIGFEQEIVGAIRDKMPAGSRVHTLGVGSGVNRSLLGPAARAGAGVEAILGLDESPDDAAKALVAATASPIVVDLQVHGSALVELAHHRAPDLMAGRPSRLGLRLRPEGGSLTVSGRTPDGTWEHTVSVPRLSTGSSAIARLVGRELVEEQELLGALGRQVDAEVERLGVTYQIATRKTSFVAVSSKQTVDPTAPGRTESVPQALPYGMSAEGLGLRSAVPAPMASPAMMQAPLRRRMRSASVTKSLGPAGIWGAVSKVLDGLGGGGPDELSAAAPPPASMDVDDEAIDEAFEPQELSSVAEEREEAAMEAPRQPALRLKARLVLAKDGRLVLEVELPIALHWAPTVASVLGTFGERAARLVAAGTTAAGHYQPGQVLRVVVEAGEGVLEVRLAGASGGRDLVLEL